MQRAVQYAFSVVAVFLLLEGGYIALGDFPSREAMVLGGVAVLGAAVALRYLWLAGDAPLKAGVGVTAGALLTMSLGYSPLSAIASLLLFAVGVGFILRELNRIARRSRPGR